MKTDNTEKKFEAYEEARIEKDSAEAKKVSDASVEAATNRINLDENTDDRG